MYSRKRKRRPQSESQNNIDIPTSHSNTAFQPENNHLYDDIRENDIQTGRPVTLQDSTQENDYHAYAVLERTPSERGESDMAAPVIPEVMPQVTPEVMPQVTPEVMPQVTPEADSKAKTVDSDEEGWVDNIAYESHSIEGVRPDEASDKNAHKQCDQQEGWVENTIYEGD